MTLQSIKQEVQMWNKAQQADLLHFLTDLIANDNFQLSERQLKEIDKREKNLRNGMSKGRPAKEVLGKYQS